jgi:hypothetical protein
LSVVLLSPVLVLTAAQEMNRRMKAADERVIALADSTQRRVADLERRFDASLRDAAAALGSRINDVDARVSDSNVAAAKV